MGEPTVHQPFTEEEVTALSAEVDAERRILDTTNTSSIGSLKTGAPRDEVLPARQREAIERATGEMASRFLAKFKRAAHQDIYHPEGVLFKQWQKYRDVTNRDVLQTFGAVLVGMGLTGSALQVAAVAIAVYVLYIGLTAFCAED